MLTVGGKKPDLRASDNGKLIHGEPIRGTPLNRNTAFFRRSRVFVLVKGDAGGRHHPIGQPRPRTGPGAGGVNDVFGLG